MSVSYRRPAALLLAAASPLVLAADPAANKPDAPDVVTVKAERQHYRSLSATGATKTDALLMDLPQSVRVLTGDLLRDAGVTTLAGALDLASGIAKQSPLGGLWDSYAMRGFTGDPNFGSDYMVNGFSSSRGYNGMRDGGNTQTVEVLKGPASALYGRGEPGGTVNITTKKPKFAPEYSADFSLGSFQARRTAVDMTGPVSGTVAYRLNAAHEEGHSFRDTLKVERSLFSPSFLWLLGEHTSVSYEIEAVQQRAPFDRGVVAVNGKLGALPVSRFLGEPGDGPMTVKSLGQQLFIHHALSDDWTLQAGASYRDSELKGFSTEANKLLADGRTLNRQRRHRDFSATDVSARVELLGKFRTGALAHEVLAGVDAYHFDDHRVQLRRNPSAANAYAIDIFNPAYGGKADPLALSIDTQEGQRARGLYVQDQLDLGAQWKALAGVRHDTYTQDVRNNRLNVSNRQSLSATSPRAGLVYQPSKAWSLYASAAKGFRPNSGISIANQAFPAERSRSYELGAKLETGKLTGTVAVYDIRKSNVLTTNPANTDFAIAAGEVGSRGLELDVSGEVARGLRVSGAYAYTNATVTRGDATIVTGSRFANVPRHSANVLATQQFALGTGTASVGGGVHHVGERLGDVAVSSSFTLPAYTTARLLASYAPNAQLRLALNVENLFNRSYYASSYSPLWVAPGAERTLTLNAHYRF
ncbi:TonB-dependent siderophore receptor [Janthinobacterium violaceinigrum]|uniref:TonB-dependent siderophore receptor n=1 Tax=Janthinobacterium violaceinigrum TaxID=2654252 RepID=A0A6I1IA45_9BURK|nr:TonB-dependent siderophore receptor [Janthinobacterium violaceinigrum]KAB8064267.1 TonB-dependent siderophore receptor [Janthinobacterium violaceinigrum]